MIVHAELQFPCDVHSIPDGVKLDAPVFITNGTLYVDGRRVGKNAYIVLDGHDFGQTIVECDLILGTG